MDYKPNSNRFKEQQREASEETKKIEKIVSGKVKTKKKTGLQKLIGSVLTEDVDGLWSNLLTEVVAPAVADTLSDILKKSVDTIFGRGTSKSSSISNKVSYRSYYDKPTEMRTRTVYDYQDVIFDSRGEAEEVLDRMDELIETYGNVSVADFYDLVGVTGNYTDNKYGWTNISIAKVVRVSDGYMIKLPRVLPLK